MPLIALLDGDRIESSRLSVGEWQELRTGYRRRDLQMVCGSLAVPKTSPRGVRFFAHHPGTECAFHAGAPETPEHLQAKTTLAKAARECGWEAAVEHVGGGGEWVADVLIHRGGTKVVLEVQWSPQTAEEFASRTGRYAASGIATRWFLGPRNHTREVPGAYLLSGTVDDLTCTIPGPLFASDQQLPLADAARVLFGEGVARYAEVRARAIEVSFFTLRCWHDACERWYSRWWVDGVQVTSRCGAQGVMEGPVGARAWAPFAPARVEENLAPHMTRLTSQEDWATPCGYRTQYTRQADRTYSTATCPYCGRVQGDAFLLARPPHRTGELTVTLDTSARADFALSRDVFEQPHQCRDVGHGRCVLETA